MLSSLDIATAASLALLAVGLVELFFRIFGDSSEKRKKKAEASATMFRNVRRHLDIEYPKLMELSYEYYKKQGVVTDEISFAVKGKRVKAYVLTKKNWIPDTPVALSSLKLTRATCWDNDKKHVDNASWSNYRSLEDLIKKYEYVLPFAEDGKKYRRYSDAITALDSHPLWWDSPGYHLTEANFDGKSELVCRLGRYYDNFDSQEVLGYEISRSSLSHHNDVAKVLSGLRARGKLGNPFDLANRASALSVGVLTLIANGKDYEFVMHKRSETEVSAARGMLHIIPAGEFEPSMPSLLAVELDFDIWKNMMREYAEEFDPNALDEQIYQPINYDKDPPFSDLNHAYRVGLIRVYVLGVVINPLVLRPELLAVAVFDDGSFDKIFARRIEKDAEGDLVWSVKKKGEKKMYQGHKFDETGVSSFISHERMTPHGKACLMLAWEKRDKILRRSRV